MTEAQLIHEGWDKWDVDEWLSRQLATWALWRAETYRRQGISPKWL